MNPSSWLQRVAIVLRETIRQPMPAAEQSPSKGCSQPADSLGWGKVHIVWKQRGWTKQGWRKATSTGCAKVRALRGLCRDILSIYITLSGDMKCFLPFFVLFFQTGPHSAAETELKLKEILLHVKILGLLPPTWHQLFPNYPLLLALQGAGWAHRRTCSRRLSMTDYDPDPTPMYRGFENSNQVWGGKESLFTLPA